MATERSVKQISLSASKQGSTWFQLCYWGLRRPHSKSLDEHTTVLRSELKTKIMHSLLLYFNWFQRGWSLSAEQKGQNNEQFITSNVLNWCLSMNPGCIDGLLENNQSLEAYTSIIPYMHFMSEATGYLGLQCLQWKTAWCQFLTHFSVKRRSGSIVNSSKIFTFSESTVALSAVLTCSSTVHLTTEELTCTTYPRCQYIWLQSEIFQGNQCVLFWKW